MVCLSLTVPTLKESKLGNVSYLMKESKLGNVSYLLKESKQRNIIYIFAYSTYNWRKRGLSVADNSYLEGIETMKRFLPIEKIKATSKFSTYFHTRHVTGENMVCLSLTIPTR